MHREFVIRCKERLLDLSNPVVMGVLNLNGDSFYSGSRYTQLDQINQRVDEMAQDDAKVIDLGAMSSRPGASIMEAEEEILVIDKLLPSIRKRYSGFLSVDTLHAKTAKVALNLGADIINDISGGSHDQDMFDVVSTHQAGYILMHMRGTPETMNQMCEYPEGVVLGVVKELKEKMNRAKSAGVENIILDPGIGFAKSVQQNFELLKHLSTLHVLECPVLLGLSRKSMIWRTLKTDPEGALNGTTALNMYAMQHHPHILRVHDTKEAQEVLKLWENLNFRDN